MAFLREGSMKLIVSGKDVQRPSARTQRITFATDVESSSINHSITDDGRLP
jgi:hypothetical protein